jgi:hypothetical protein
MKSQWILLSENCWLTYVIMGFRNRIDFVDGGTDNVDKDPLAYYLGYYDWGRGVSYSFL